MKTRKSLLISSVAMLLVAMLALGTATFAWFTSSTTTIANGVNVQTIKSSKLVISKKDKDWKQAINYGQNDQILRPVSSADGANWFKADALHPSSYATKIAGDQKYNSVNGDLGNYVFVEQLNVANQGEVAVNNVKITIKGFTNSYGRIALVPADENGTPLVEGSFKSYVYDNGGAAYYPVVNETTPTPNLTIDEYGQVTNVSYPEGSLTITPSTSKTITVGDLVGKVGESPLGGAKYFNLYIWFEGQDVDCIDTNAGQYIGDISFEVSGDTADQ